MIDGQLDLLDELHALGEGQLAEPKQGYGDDEERRRRAEKEEGRVGRGD